MKKTLFIALAALAALASCTSDDTVAQQPKQLIGFDGFVNKSTRATDATAQNLQDFAVYGFLDDATGTLFAGQKVYGGIGAWTYDNTQYWSANHNYWFAAVAPFTAAHWTYDTNNVVSGGKLTFDNAAADGEQDLLYAYSGQITTPATLTASDPAKVQFTFNHALAKVVFRFSSDYTNPNTRFSVEDITITNAYAAGTADMDGVSNAAANLNALVWDVTGQDNTFALNFGGIDKFVSTANATCETKYMLPANAAYNVTFTVKQWQGEVLDQQMAYTVALPQVDMKAGNSYRFSAVISPKQFNDDQFPIVFDVQSVNDFGDFDDQGNIIPNAD